MRTVISAYLACTWWASVGATWRKSLHTSCKWSTCSWKRSPHSSNRSPSSEMAAARKWPTRSASSRDEASNSAACSRAVCCSCSRSSCVHCSNVRMAVSSSSVGECLSLCSCMEPDYNGYPLICNIEMIYTKLIPARMTWDSPDRTRSHSSRMFSLCSCDV